MVSPALINPNVTHLKEVKLLQVFTEDELKDLLKKGQVEHHEAHSNIVIEGETSWGLYLVLEGLVGVFKTNKLTGDTYDIGQLAAGKFFGEMSLVDENPRSATVRALVDSHVFHIPKDRFSEFLAAKPDRRIRFYESCIRDLSSRLKDLNDVFIETQYQLWRNAIQRKKEAA
jgi:CRP-like cAMP-binding protein